MPEYRLFFEDDVYADMVQYQYDASRWMHMDRVPTRAADIPRSKKKLDELCKKGVVLIGDTMTTRKTDGSGNKLSFSATIESLDQHSNPLMRTTGQTGNNLWTCIGPIQFVEAMVQAHPGLKIPPRNTWDLVQVTRNDEELGSLQEIRQCFQLWELEIEKWGCNGLGEGLSDGRPPRRD